MRIMIHLLTFASLILSSLSFADENDEYEEYGEYEEYEDFNPLEYSYQYSPHSGTDFKNYYRQNPLKDHSNRTEGSCYFNACRASQLTVGVAIGAAMVIAIIAIVVEDGTSAHCH